MGPHSTPREVAAWYADRAVEHERRAADMKRHAGHVSDGRLVAFFAFVIAGAWWFASSTHQAVSAAATVALFAGFVALVVWHGRLVAEMRRAHALGRLHRDGVARVNRDWDALPAFPAAVPRGHPYAADLDVVGGRASLVRLLGAVSPLPGRAALMRFLLAPAPDAATLAGRQEAVTELAGRVDLRNELMLAAIRSTEISEGDIAAFIAWARGGGWLLARPAVLWAARLLPLATLALLVLAMSGGIGIRFVALPIVAGLVLTSLEHRRVQATFVAALLNANGMRQQTAMLALLAGERFDALLLRRLRDRLGEGRGAHRELRRLERVLTLGEVRFSAMLHGALQLLLLWDFHVVALLERWQGTAGARVGDWLDTLGEVEALGAIATLAHDNPDWSMPSIVQSSPSIVAEGIAHPLLAPTDRVANDVSVGPPGTILLVTGSNMSGKSTLLRAVGLNTILALAGGPVCARRLVLPLLDVWTSIRVEDSLAEGVSLFMAELQRLKAVVDAARGRDRRRPMLYLLDEILHGTNTAERQVAARTILGHLVRSGAIGAITTHDLTLAADGALARAAVAVHFTETFVDTAEGERMTFDYRLRPGLATSSNAIRLLEMLGLGD